MRIPLAIIQLKLSNKITRSFYGLGRIGARFFSNLDYDLEKTDLSGDGAKYFLFAKLNSFVYFVVFFFLLFYLNYVTGKETAYSIYSSLILSLFLGIIIFIALIRYPKILAGKKAERIDKNLVFALKDLLLQINSGVNFYNAIVNIGKSNYGLISKELTKVAREIKAGKPVEKALEVLAIQTGSDYLKKTIWQIVNSLRSGSSLKGALKNIINELVDEQKGKIKNYTHELNLWSLIYMLFAVAIPTIGAVMLIILSGFAGVGINKATFVSFVVLTFIAQIIIIGFIKTRRPIVNL